jgi:hypothetical protein
MTIQPSATPDTRPITGRHAEIRQHFQDERGAGTQEQEGSRPEDAARR